jgi:hypothetical protein
LAIAARSAVQSVRLKIISLLKSRKGRTNFNIDVFSNPEKYFMRLPMDKIVADTKVFPEAVEMYKRKIENGETIALVIVVKHPRYNVYAVLDGHHRYYAYLELGRKKIDCALAGDISSVVFFITERGYLQPNPNAKELIKNPEIRFHDKIQEFLQAFLKEPIKTKHKPSLPKVTYG